MKSHFLCPNSWIATLCLFHYVTIISHQAVQLWLSVSSTILTIYLHGGRCPLSLTDNCFPDGWFAVQVLYFIPRNKVCTSSLIYIRHCPAQQRTPLWIPYLHCAAALISSPWRRFMSGGISGQNGLIESVYSPVQSLRIGLGNEGENDKWKTLWL